jgi:hypothetical protein
VLIEDRYQAKLRSAPLMTQAITTAVCISPIQFESFLAILAFLGRRTCLWRTHVYFAKANAIERGSKSYKDSAANSPARSSSPPAMSWRNSSSRSAASRSTIPSEHCAWEHMAVVRYTVFASLDGEVYERPWPNTNSDTMQSSSAPQPQSGTAS